MHFITILKSTGEIVDYRSDTSVPANWTAETLQAAVSKDRELAENAIQTLLFQELPEREFDASIALNLREHAYDVVTGRLKNNPSYVPPVVERRWTTMEVMPHLTLAEKSKFLTNSTPSVITAKEEFKTPRNQQDTTEILQFLVDSGDISQASMDKVLA